MKTTMSITTSTTTATTSTTTMTLLHVASSYAGMWQVQLATCAVKVNINFRFPRRPYLTLSH